MTFVVYINIIKTKISFISDLCRKAVKLVSENIESAGKSLKQVAYETLKQKIVSCEILPGSTLTEDMLCEMLNASRTPVRDAVSRLEQEHLVSIKPKKGIRVNRVSMNSIKELFEVRCLLEPAAVLKYGNRIPDDVYARYTRQFQLKNLPTEELYRVDDEFHRMFISASGNRYFHTVYAMIADQVQRYRVLTANRPQDELAQDEHYEIAACCIRGEWSQASRLMLEHIENAKLFIVRYVLDTNRNSRNVFLEDEDD